MPSSLVEMNFRYAFVHVPYRSQLICNCLSDKIKENHKPGTHASMHGPVH